MSLEEAGCLEHWGDWPQCRSHRHCKKREAEELVAAGTCRWVGGEGTRIGVVSMIVTNRVSIWTPIQLHDEKGKAILGFKQWGLKPMR